MRLPSSRTAVIQVLIPSVKLPLSLDALIHHKNSFKNTKLEKSLSYCHIGTPVQSKTELLLPTYELLPKRFT